MYIVQKNTEKVMLHDKDSANKLIYLLTILGCTDAISKREIIGIQNEGQLFIIKEDETEIMVIGQEHAEIITHWLLSLGINDISITRINETEEEIK